LSEGKNKVTQAEIVGIEMGKRLNKLKIEKAIFDRSFYKYHGRVAALANGIRKSNINL
jgi:large subunit ribosomal protein L18